MLSSFREFCLFLSRWVPIPRCAFSLLALSVLLGGCLEEVEYPQALRFEDAVVGSAPGSISFSVHSLADVPLTLRAYSWSPEWLSASTNRITLQPGGSGTIGLSAAECEESGDREGVLAISADGKPAFVRVDMTCVSLGPDARFGDVGAHQGTRIGPTEFSPDLEIPIVNDRPGAFRAEVLANFNATAHIEVEAVVLDANGEPVPGLSPLERLREPVEFDHGTATYAAVHEFKAPAAAFREDVEVVLRIDPDGRLPEDALDNNEVRPLDGAPRLPEPLPSFVFHLVPVSMTIVKDGEELALEGFVPDCPGNCLSAALDMLPLPAQRVEVREHPSIDLGMIEWTSDHANAPFGMAGDVTASVRGHFDSEGGWVDGVPSERQTIIALAEDSIELAWANGAGGLSGNPILVMLHRTVYEANGERSWDHDYLAVDIPRTIAHEIGHNFHAFHAWFDSDPDAAYDPIRDHSFPYVDNGGGKWGTTPFISGDPDGDGPLRVRPAYAHRGSASETYVDWRGVGFLNPTGFADQSQPVGEIMAGSLPYEHPAHISDFHYLITLFGAGWNADLLWGDAPCLEIDNEKYDENGEYWRTSQRSCPWRISGDAVAARGKSKSATQAISENSAPSVHVSGYVDVDGRFPSAGAHAMLGGWPSMRLAKIGEYMLVGYDAHGMSVHEQPLPLLPAFHLKGVRHRYEAIIPRPSVRRVEVRDQNGALMISIDVMDEPTNQD